jgi:hypothetical protein
MNFYAFSSSFIASLLFRLQLRCRGFASLADILIGIRFLTRFLCCLTAGKQDRASQGMVA